MRPSHIFPTLPLALLTVICSSPAHADEVRMKDGRVLVGTVVKKDGGERLQIRTRSGTVDVAADEVLSIRTDSELRTELSRLEKSTGKSAFAALNLARTARSYGLDTEMWSHLSNCIDAVGSAKTSSTQRQLSKFLKQLEADIVPPRLAQADTKKLVLGLVRMVRPGLSTAKRAVLIETLVTTPEADKLLRDQAIRGYLPTHRLAATEALRRRPGRGNDRFALFRTLKDNDSKNRKAVANLYRDRAGEATQRLAPGLMHDDPAIRIRTAQAFANLGAPEGAALLAMAGPRAGMPAGDGSVGVRAHMFAITQRAYIKDFDVEIAQAAAVANPVIGVVSDGVVLDVHVAAVVSMQIPITRAYRRALMDLTSKDPGADPNTWVAWLKRANPEAAKLLAQR